MQVLTIKKLTGAGEKLIIILKDQFEPLTNLFDCDSSFQKSFNSENCEDCRG